ncbi:MAG: glycosyltransferase [Proteobacteria bacterium]|nr:glycosyltransferase [Pseudomonadota bacterium]
MMPGEPQPVCTVIICTMAVAERADSLGRAIASVLGQNDTPISVLVVVNGDRYDEKLVADLKRRKDIDVLQIAARSLSDAIAAGRSAVKSPYFGFLDDDDEYLPQAIDLRLAELERHPDAGVLVTNGYRCRENFRETVMSHLNLVTEDPLTAIFREPWLASCSGLYRAAVAREELFEKVARYAEWTWLGFVLARAGIEVRTLDRPTFCIYETPKSESKSDEYLDAQISIFNRMLALAPTGEVRRILKNRIRDTWHHRADVALGRGQLASAWRFHLSSLLALGGWRYALFTRYLIPGWPKKS